jgi:hypothetical protein
LFVFWEYFFVFFLSFADLAETLFLHQDQKKKSKNKKTPKSLIPLKEFTTLLRMSFHTANIGFVKVMRSKVDKIKKIMKR